jgi:hypothetical protein
MTSQPDSADACVSLRPVADPSRRGRLLDQAHTHLGRATLPESGRVDPWAELKGAIDEPTLESQA